MQPSASLIQEIIDQTAEIIAHDLTRIADISEPSFMAHSSLNIEDTTEPSFYGMTDASYHANASREPSIRRLQNQVQST